MERDLVARFRYFVIVCRVKPGDSFKGVANECDEPRPRLGCTQPDVALLNRC